MTSTIKVNNIQNQCGANIINESSNTITIGASGDTVSLASGASQSGFGRSGSVDWQTSIKTATFTAASGEGYFCNTSGGAFTVNLPSSPSVGDIVAIKDYGSSFATNSLTIGRGGSNLNGEAADSIRSIDNESLTMVYADATKGWLAVEEGTGNLGSAFISATGGTITTCGNFKIHTFTSPGTFSVTSGAGSKAIANYLVVAGGGGGGSSAPSNGAGGGGGGGFREAKTSCNGCYTASPLVTSTGLQFTPGSFPITVGAGGSGGPCNTKGTDGSNSVVSSITSAGGGAGGGNASRAGNNGGSGGGGSGGGFNQPGGSGNTPPVSPPQGSNGGPSVVSGPTDKGGGGGGGATAVGSTGTSPIGGGGRGGAGATTNIDASPKAYSGGGGSADATSSPCGTGGASNGGSGCATAGTTNRGGGGGASRCVGTGGANGGSGVVIIRYKFQ